MEFQVLGGITQAVAVQMRVGEEVRAEAGAMLYKTAGVDMQTQLTGGLLGGLKRMVMGESLFIPHFKCAAPQGVVTFAAPYPGTVRRLDLAGVAWLCQRDSFLLCTGAVEVSIAFTRKLGAGFFGGEGFILQKLSGQGTAFVHGGGDFLEFNLGPADMLQVDTGCIVAFEETVQYDIQFVGGFRNTLFGGEGLFVATVRGPGKAILQTLPFSRLAGRIMGKTSEGSSSTGGLANTLGGIFGSGD